MKIEKTNKFMTAVVIALFLVFLAILEVSDYGERGIYKYCSNFNTFDMTWNYTPSYVYKMLDIISYEGIYHYKIYLLFDTVFTFLFGYVQYILSRSLCDRNKLIRLNAVFIVLILIRISGDFIENILLMFIMSSYPVQYENAVLISNIITMIKLSSLKIFIALILMTGCALVIRSLANRFLPSKKSH